MVTVQSLWKGYSLWGVGVPEHHRGEMIQQYVASATTFLATWAKT